MVRFQKILISFLLVSLISHPARAQQDKGYLELVKAEEQLKYLFNVLYDQEFMEEKLDIYFKIDTVFERALSIPGSMNFDWQKLNKIGKLKSDDGQLKVFSWYYTDSDSKTYYSCYIQCRDKKDKSIVYSLKSDEELDKRKEIIKQQKEHWIGKVYYELITEKYRRKTFYTLLGADFNDMTTMIKCIEILTLQRGKPVFKRGGFSDQGAIKDRIVFEYSSNYAASVHYDDRLRMIVYDHLAPIHPLYDGIYQFYGPDGSYDGFKFMDGQWVRLDNVDARNR